MQVEGAMEQRFDYCDRNRLSLHSCIVSKPKLATLARQLSSTTYEVPGTKARNPSFLHAGFLGPCRVQRERLVLLFGFSSTWRRFRELFGHDNGDGPHTQNSGTVYARFVGSVLF